MAIKMTESQRKNLPFWIDGGMAVLLITLIWQVSGWKSQMDAEIGTHREQIAKLSAQSIHPEADRRLSVVETDAINRSREIAEMKADLVRRLERIDEKLDRLSK